MHRALLLFVATYFLFTATGQTLQEQSGQAGKRMTPELLLKLGRVGSPALSNNQRYLAWTVRRYELAENTGRSDLCLMDLDDRKEVCLLEGWKSVGDLQWTDTGAGGELWFVGQKTAEEPAEPQIFRIQLPDENSGLADLQPAQISHFDRSPANLKVAPDGKRFAFTFDVKLDQNVNELYADLPKADARIIDSLMYRHWDSWHDYAYSHLHVAELASDGTLSKPVDYMEGQRNDCPVPPFGGSEQIAWSPDSSRIAYTTKISDHPEESTDSSVWVVKAGEPGSALDVSAGRPGYDNNPFWSPDGRRLGFHSMVRPGFEADRNRIMVYQMDSRSLNEATENLDQNAEGSTFTAAGDSIVFASDMNGTHQLFLRMQGPGGETRQLTQGDFNWGMVGMTSGGKAVVTRQSMERPDELFLLDSNTGEAEQLSHTNDAIFAELELPTFVRREVTATDGKKIMCWVALPPGFDPADDKKWPLLLYCQGGPQSQIGQWFSFRWNFHLMAAKGYVVIAPNRRGLPGFGQAWNDEISGDWGGQAMRDLLSATDDISSEPYIDTGRRAAVGASFGGYSVYWLMGNHAGRFQAMIAHCGVFNLESMYGGTEELFFVNWDLGGPYWKSEEVLKKYEAFSPHRYAGNWDTPLLVIHGQKDFRVPVTQGMEAFTVAQVNRVPSRFLYFPEEGHWVQGAQNGVLWQRVFYDWLDRNLNGAKDDSAGK